MQWKDDWITKAAKANENRERVRAFREFRDPIFLCSPPLTARRVKGDTCERTD